MQAKHFSDLRIKIGQQKPRDSNTIENEVSEVISDLDDDQWGEIHNHDYQLWVEQEAKKKRDHQLKRDKVRDTLNVQLKE
jgi:hypothetical protein